MNATMLLWERLRKSRMIAWLAPEKALDCIVAYEALNPLGVILEIGLTSPAALEGLKALREKHPYALVLAGNVMTHHQVDLVIDSGACGVVSNDFIPIVTEVCARRDILCIPAGLSDVGKQLVQKATLYNCELDELRIHHPYQWIYMLFPALAGSANHLKMATVWKSIYKNLLVVYAGGVCRENLREIVSNDDTGIIRSKLITSFIDQPERMRQEVEEWLGMIHKARSEEIEEAEAVEETVEKEVDVLEEEAEVSEATEPLEEETGKPDEETVYSEEDDSSRVYVNL
ncbi:MAG: hypothetical protein KJ645_04290 [Planctomycetes bacterium]|nr:hypothetical protein [Planctomycetota bacterium]